MLGGIENGQGDDRLARGGVRLDIFGGERQSGRPRCLCRRCRSGRGRSPLLIVISSSGGSWGSWKPRPQAGSRCAHGIRIPGSKEAATKRKAWKGKQSRSLGDRGARGRRICCASWRLKKRGCVVGGRCFECSFHGRTMEIPLRAYGTSS